MISAIVLAAGQSKRMGAQKMLMPWGNTTVIGKVVSSLVEAGIGDIHVVTGGNHDKIGELISRTEAYLVHNPDYANGEMLTSVQVGIKEISSEGTATLITLGDQPQIEPQLIKSIVERYQATRHSLIVPSYQMHRGHPWLLGKTYWDEVVRLKPPLTLHDFLNAHNDEIDYVNVNTPSVMQDLDTRDDYSQYKP